MAYEASGQPPRAAAGAAGRPRRTRHDEVDVGYRTVDGPVGPLLLAATPTGLVRVAFASEGEDAVLQELADRVSPRVLPLPARLDETARELDEYFGGRRRRFDVPLDWQLSSGFRRDVLTHLAVDVEYGHTTSYAGLASLEREPAGGAGGRHGVRDQPDPGGGAVPPGRALGRVHGSLPRGRGGQARPPRARGRALTCAGRGGEGRRTRWVEGVAGSRGLRSRGAEG